MHGDKKKSNFRLFKMRLAYYGAIRSVDQVDATVLKEIAHYHSLQIFMKNVPA